MSVFEVGAVSVVDAGLLEKFGLMRVTMARRVDWTDNRLSARAYRRDGARLNSDVEFAN